MRWAVGLLMVLAGAAAGCTVPAAPRFSNPMVFTNAAPSQVEVAAERIVMELRFEIERPPAGPGRITTLPLTGASWFEFWRRDTRGAYQSVEASAHTVRRLVTVQVTPRDKGCQVLVKVDKQRLSAPNVMPDNIAESFSKYDPQDSELVRQNELSAKKYKWLDSGRDEVLEQYILEHIQLAVGRAGRAPAPRTLAPAPAAPAAPAGPAAAPAPADASASPTAPAVK